MRSFGFLVLAFAILAPRSQPPNGQQPRQIVQRFPEGIVKARMFSAANNFNSVYGDYVRIGSIVYQGPVENKSKAVHEMLASGVILESGRGIGRPAIWPLESARSEHVDLTYLKDSLGLNVERGDYMIDVTLKDLHTNKMYSSLNSMSPDGNRFSGVLFATTRIRGGFATTSEVQNTACHAEVIDRYLWGSPADFAKGCVTGTCKDGKCEDCTITESEAFGGFFGSAKIVPRVGSPGRRMPNSCRGYFNWAWATGFKVIKVKAGASFEGTGGSLELDIEGNWGQSGEGGFTVGTICPGAARR